MTSISGITKFGAVFALFALLVTPFLSYALSRTDSRLNAATMRESTSNQGSTSGSGGTSGNTGGNTGTTSEEEQIAAEELFEDLIQNGPDTDQLPPDTDLGTDEIAEAVAEIEADEEWGSGFVTVLHLIIFRFTNR